MFKGGDHAFEVRVARAELARKPVAAAHRDLLLIREHVELTLLANLEDGVYIEALLDQGRETRGLGLVVLSRRAILDFDLHLASRSRVTLHIGADPTSG